MANNFINKSNSSNNGGPNNVVCIKCYEEIKPTEKYKYQLSYPKEINQKEIL